MNAQRDKKLGAKLIQIELKMCNGGHDLPKDHWSKKIVEEIFNYDDIEEHPRIKLSIKHLNDANLLRRK